METVTPMSLGRMLRYGLSLSIATALPAGLLSIAAIAPFMVLLTNMVRQLLLAVAETIDSSGVHDFAVESARFGDAFMAAHSELPQLFFLALFLLLVGITYAVTAATILDWNVVIRENQPFSSMLSRTFGRPFWVAMAQTVIILGIVFLLSSVYTFLSAGLPNGEGFMQLILRVALFLFSAITIFRIHEVVADDRGPWRGMISSIVLARAGMLRVFIVLLLIAIMSIIMIQVVSMFSGFESDASTTVVLAAMMSSKAGPIAQAMRFVATLLTVKNALLATVAVALTLVFGVGLLTALYTDLRARRGDFEPEPVEIVPTTPV